MSTKPPMGSNNDDARNMVPRREPGITSWLLAAVVLTVRVDVPEPPETEAELNAQVGAGVPPPLTLHVSFTVLL